MIRTYSNNSITSLNKLIEYKNMLIQIEQEIINIENNINSNNYKILLSKITQLNGKLDNLQFNKIDSISTHNLKSGKNEVRQTRKFLNSKCKIIRNNLLKLYYFLKDL